MAPFRSRLADRLSGGMKQKLALACTLIHTPELLVLDEPTTGVDPVSRREFWKLLSQFLSHGITILMSTPYLDEAERCSRIALLHEGRLLALDEPARLRSSLPGTLLEVLVESPREAQPRLVAAGGLSGVQVFGDRLHVWLDAPGPSRAEAEFAAVARRVGINATGVRVVAPSLEDVFIAKLSSTDEARVP
jgi:ABC-2 type transport system ATP-binding protein